IAIGIVPIPSPPMPGRNIINPDTFAGNILLIPTSRLYVLSVCKGLQQAVQSQSGEEGCMGIIVCQQPKALGVAMIPVVMGNQNIIQIFQLIRGDGEPGSSSYKRKIKKCGIN